MRLRRLTRPHTGQVELNVIPLIDVVFFLLVFYVISTSFLTEAAVPVQRPSSAQAAAVTQPFVPVAIARGGAVFLGDHPCDVAALPAAVAEALAHANATRVVVVADRDTPTGRLLQVMDACSAGGATAVDVAAQPAEGTAP
jgi:biopolymer transport protein ExbD